MAEGGTPRVALICAQVPRALIEACGLEPWTISGREDVPPDPALPQNLCPLVRRAAALLAPRGSETCAAVVLADSCYPLVRLHDHLAAARPGGTVLLLRVPRRGGADNVRFFRAELLRLARALAHLGGRAPDERALRRALAADARRRAAWNSFIAGAADGTMPTLTAELLRELEEGRTLLPPGTPATARPVEESRTRLLLAGSCFVSGELLRVLDGLGAAVVAVDACGYLRPSGVGQSPPAPGADAWESLARAWLSRPPCPRGEDAARRADAAVALAGRGSLDAVLYLRTSCCTPQGYDQARWHDRLAAAGVPFFPLETDGDAWGQPRLVTRIEAFLESLAGRRRAGAVAR